MAQKKPYRFFLYLAARALAALIFLVPRRLALKLARGFGRLAFVIVGRHREKTLENLRLAYGSEKSEAEIRQMAREVFSHMSQAAVEVLQFPKLARGRLEDIIDFGEMCERYESLLREGRGVISITAHIGNWELMGGAIFHKRVCPGCVVGRRIYYEPYNRWILKLRQTMNMKTIYRDQSVKDLLGILKRNEIIGMVPDQDVDSLKGVFVNFFGRPAYTPSGPVKLALASGAPIFAVFMIREPRGRYRVVAGEVIRPMIETTREAAVQKYTELWTKEFEKVIRQYPEQWAWMHDRWKTQPQNPWRAPEGDRKKEDRGAARGAEVSALKFCSLTFGSRV